MCLFFFHNNILFWHHSHVICLTLLISNSNVLHSDLLCLQWLWIMLPSLPSSTGTNNIHQVLYYVARYIPPQLLIICECTTPYSLPLSICSSLAMIFSSLPPSLPLSPQTQCQVCIWTVFMCGHAHGACQLTCHKHVWLVKEMWLIKLLPFIKMWVA